MISSSAAMQRAVAYSKKEPIVVSLLVLLVVVWILPHDSLFQAIDKQIQRQYTKVPSVKVDLHPYRTWANRYSPNKTALYIETKEDVNHATPLLLHMTQVVPPDWRFLFVASEKLMRTAGDSAAVQRMVESGKLRLQSIERWSNDWPNHMTEQQKHSRLLTNMSWYDEQIPKTEHLFVFRSNSILCASSIQSIDDYLDYDWIGAPWEEDDKYGGTGGLSLRKMSRVREVLKFQDYRMEEFDKEDKWLSSRIGILPGANNADATVSGAFAVENIWADEPLGYHVKPDLRPGDSPHVWDPKEKRKEIFQYCPEVKIILPMRFNREHC